MSNFETFWENTIKKIADWIDSPTAYLTLAILGIGVAISLLAIAFSRAL